MKSFLVLQVVGSQLGQPGVNGRGSVGYEVQAREPPTSWTLKVTLGTSALIPAETGANLVSQAQEWHKI